MVEVKIALISADKNNGSPVVVLNEIETDGKRGLLIWIAEAEAAAIRIGIEERSFPRPMTHDLLKNIIDALSAKVTAICINAFEKNIFYAKIQLKSEEEEFDIDSRPSDALAIAIRYNVPIYVEDDVIENNGFTEKEEDRG